LKGEDGLSIVFIEQRRPFPLNSTDPACRSKVRQEAMIRGDPKSGFGTIEMVIVLTLFGIVAVSLVGLQMIAISAGTAAETSSIAANLARERMEELLTLTPAQIIEQNNAQVLQQVPASHGRLYAVHTAVVAPDPSRLDITVEVTWHLAYGSACAAGGPGAGCTGSQATYTRTLQTRIRRPNVTSQ
jgi:type II secretory pathway pseudopilin PulG